MSSKTNIWVEGTIIAALAMILSFIPTNIGSSFSVSLGQIPLTVFAIRRGWRPGLMAGLVWGLLHFPLGQVWYLSVLQVMIEYPFAFTFAGFAGLYSQKIYSAIHANAEKKAIRSLITAAFVGAAARYFWHFVAGWIFWGAYALWNLKPWVFSLVMNSASGAATAIVTAVVLVFLYRSMPQIFTPKS
ncbi:hypothetical protein A5886_000458 [Enterococcus sp. 8G7_MSG3316]|uniref:Thiamin permease n=1 Tax=Candidatus Enterococcus testudinis TaxID=1834191 RepID=A0A242A2X1_9ENTE|nr:energy-coupled thiamine transporter ThiT [Enterococcus sp. 8G7_MSG3316]OTN75388.1 hypothetical protein A5886_000458 [Enterococcus sp. 8G7_MSG3316]